MEELREEEVYSPNTGGRRNRNRRNRGQQHRNGESKGDNMDGDIPPPPISSESEAVGEDQVGSLLLLGSREAERNLLIILNKRFEKIIEKNRQLQLENRNLEQKVEMEQMKCSAKVTEIKSMANDQLEKVRYELNASKKEVSTLKFVLEDAKQDSETLKSRLQKIGEEVEGDKRKIGDLESQVDELNYELKRAHDQNHKLDKELKEWKNEAVRGVETLADAREQLEKETFLRLDLERDLNNKLNETYLQMTISETEIAQVKAYTTDMMEDQREKQQKELEEMLEERLGSLRDEYCRKLEENKYEQERLYAIKEADHVAKEGALSEEVFEKEGELRSAEGKVRELTEEGRKLEAERHALLLRLDTLEEERSAERGKLEKEIRNRDKLIAGKVTEKKELLSQCQHLLDVKVALDNELATYKLLLETEESRLELAGFEKKDLNQNEI